MESKSVNLLVVGAATILALTTSVGSAQAVAAATPAPSLARITVDAVDAPLIGVLQTIVRQAHLQVSFGKKIYEWTERVTMHVHDVPVDEAFARALAQTGLRAEVSSGFVDFIAVGANGAGEPVRGGIAGTVLDAKTKRPIPGAKITLDDAGTRVTSDNAGGFRIANASAGVHVLHVRMVSYAKTSTTLTVVDGELCTIHVELEPSTNVLEQVVVTGTVVPTERKALPNAITVITAKELEARGITHIDQLFRGDVPGLFVGRRGQFNADHPGQVILYARGTTVLSGGSVTGAVEGVKTYVDGIELADKTYLGLIDPKSIERIEIVTGPEASTIYGSNAISGVIQIFTKRGSTPKPQVTTTLRSSWTQNNFSASVAPQHDVGIEVTGIDGHLSYNTGASWQYQGSWVPAVQGQTASGYAGGRIQVAGFSTDLTLRALRGGNRSNGASQQVVLEQGATGEGNALVNGGGVPVRNVQQNTDNSLGLTSSYTMARWWSHTLTLGVDRLTLISNVQDPNWTTPGDSLRYLVQTTAQRLTGAYSTTLRIPLTAAANALVTVGADESHATSTQEFGNYQSVNNGFSNQNFVFSRSVANEHGGFLQSQLGLWDAVFVQYGLRAVYNPNIGKDQNPNLEPKYGIAWTQAFGGVTAKVRASYGHSTRPPTLVLTNAIRMGSDPIFGPIRVQRFGDTLSRYANPNLLPEQQKGGEGGIELYVGNRASLTVTRFNQTVDNLIVDPIVDSIDALPAQRALHGWRPWQVHYQVDENLNLGSICNQGWEATSSMSVGVLNLRGTYSWAKSRLIALAPRFRAQFPEYVAGIENGALPEHTYGVEIAYARGGTRIAYNLQGQGEANRSSQRLAIANDIRLAANNAPLSLLNGIPSNYTEKAPGYALGDVNASQQFTPWLEGLVQITNVTNSYHSDFSLSNAQPGRTTGIGLRFRF